MNEFFKEKEAVYVGRNHLFLNYGQTGIAIRALLRDSPLYWFRPDGRDETFTVRLSDVVIPQDQPIYEVY